MREFCEYRNILPRGVKLSAEDIWDRCAYVLSVKCRIRSLPGRPKNVSLASVCGIRFWRGERCLHPVAEPNVQGGGAVGRDGDFQRPASYAAKSGAQKLTSGPALPGNWLTVPRRILTVPNYSLVEGDSAGGLPSRRAIANIRRSCH